VSDRWIIRTLLDLEATDGETWAAAKAATPAERQVVLNEIEMRRWWLGLRQRDIEGKMAHLREQYPALGDVPREGRREGLP
jgi:hypothetical protein